MFFPLFLTAFGRHERVGEIDEIKKRSPFNSKEESFLLILSKNRVIQTSYRQVPVTKCVVQVGHSTTLGIPAHLGHLRNDIS